MLQLFQVSISHNISFLFLRGDIEVDNITLTGISKLSVKVKWALILPESITVTLPKLIVSANHTSNLYSPVGEVHVNSFGNIR